MIDKELDGEKRLLQEVALGSERAFRVIYDRYYRPLYAFSRKLLKEDILAEETVQEVFLKVWKNAGSFIEVNNLESYLVTIARNRCYDQLRRNKLRAHANLEEQDASVLLHNETEEGILLNETRRIIQNAVDKLPPQQKQVYTLCHQEGYKYEEAAKALNLSSDTVKSYMKYALKNLREQLGNHPDLAALLILLKLL